jgi:RimJ/RimL family protein N-acetyltransferase
LLKQIVNCPFYTTVAVDNEIAIKLVEAIGYEKQAFATINKIPMILFRER